MAEFPGLTMWTDAYLADTTHLTDAEHGRYLLMLFHMWRMPGRRFPNDDEWLARKFGRSVEQIGTGFRPLIAEFFRNDGNWITHKRLLREFTRLSGVSSQRSEAAKARWNKHKEECGSICGPALQPQPHNKSKTLESPPSVTEVKKPLSQTPPHGGNGHDKPKPEERGKRLPEDWEPSETAIAHCRNELGATAEILNREFAAFMDWGLSATGPASRKRSWDRAFVNWIRRVMNGIREQEDRERRWAERRAATR